MTFPPLPPIPQRVNLGRTTGELPTSKAPRLARIVGLDGKVWTADADRAGFQAVPTGSGRFDFALIDVSTAEDGAQVLILDGEVIGCNDDPIAPSGMPSGDTYVLPVADGDEIWQVIVWSLEADDEVSGENIESVDFDSGPVTPDDDGLTQYITIGRVSVDSGGDIPIVTATNEVCGDVNIPYPPSLDQPDPENPVDYALVVDKDTGNKVWKKVCTTPCP